MWAPLGLALVVILGYARWWGSTGCLRAPMFGCRRLLVLERCARLLPSFDELQAGGGCFSERLRRRRIAGDRRGGRGPYPAPPRVGSRPVGVQKGIMVGKARPPTASFSPDRGSPPPLPRSPYQTPCAKKSPRKCGFHTRLRLSAPNRYRRGVAYKKEKFSLFGFPSLWQAQIHCTQQTTQHFGCPG